MKNYWIVLVLIILLSVFNIPKAIAKTCIPCQCTTTTVYEPRPGQCTHDPAYWCYVDVKQTWCRTILHFPCTECVPQIIAVIQRTCKIWHGSQNVIGAAPCDDEESVSTKWWWVVGAGGEPCDWVRCFYCPQGDIPPEHVLESDNCPNG